MGELESELGALHHDLIELTRGIHPSVLRDRGLVEAIRTRTEKLALPVRLEVAGAVDCRRYRDEIESAAYFVCSEALTNVLKHALANQAVVRLSAGEGWQRLGVEDDGSGFNGLANGGHGLANMADRLAALGGQLKVVGRPDAGTTILAELPVGSGA